MDQPRQSKPAKRGVRKRQEEVCGKEERNTRVPSMGTSRTETKGGVV